MDSFPFGLCLCYLQFVFPCSLFVSQRIDILVGKQMCLNLCAWLHFRYFTRSRTACSRLGTFEICIGSSSSVSRTAGWMCIYDMMQEYSIIPVLTVTLQGRHDNSHFKNEETEAQ